MQLLRPRVRTYQQLHYSKAHLQYWYIPQQEYSLPAALLYQFDMLQVFYQAIFLQNLRPLQWCHIEQHLQIYLYLSLIHI